jgi:hypothetical protein
MRIIVAAVVLTALAGCVTRQTHQPVTEAITYEPGVASYYDRNSDGVVDFEFHDPGCCDRNWGLLDTDFDGRYDKRITWGWGTNRYGVDLPVPEKVTVSAGEPPLSGWQN